MADRVTQIMTDLADRYGAGPPGHRHAAIAKQSFQLDLVTGLAPGGSVIDIGGGLSLFAAACVALGMPAVLIDDFGDPQNDEYGQDPLEFLAACGVEVVARDVLASGLGRAAGSADVVTSFDSMEHWHRSPKDLFAEVTRVLRPGGWFVLGAPNCVHLRKRLTVPFGDGKWSSMDTWYEQPEFRGHVREPDVDDLRYIARDMGLVEVEVLGRNWQGYASRYPLVKRLIPHGDRFLQRRPSLCSNLYLIGRTPVG